MEYRHQILNPNPIFPGFIIARLIGNDHARFQRRIAAALGNPLRSFMHIEETANAVAGAVLVIKPGLPEILPRQRIELRTARAVGKARGGNGDVALKHAGETVDMFRRWRANGYRARDVGRTIGILATGIEQEQFALLQCPVALRRYAVMHDSAVGAASGNGGKARLDEQWIRSAKAKQHFGNFHFRYRTF